MKTPQSVRNHLRQHTGPYLLAAFLLLVILYLVYQNAQSQKRFMEQTGALRQKVQENQLAVDQQQLTLMMKTFGWAVRNALLQNKTGEINEYFNLLVQTPGVQEVLLVDLTGKVTVSSNKKNQGITFATRFPDALLRQQEVYFSQQTPYALSVPVTAPNQRLGTLILFYRPQPVLPPVDSLTRP